MHWIISHLLDSMKYTFTFSFRIDENQPTHQSKERNMKRKKKSSSLFYLNFREKVYLKTGLEKKFLQSITWWLKKPFMYIISHTIYLMSHMTYIYI